MKATGAIALPTVKTVPQTPAAAKKNRPGRLAWNWKLCLKYSNFAGKTLPPDFLVVCRGEPPSYSKPFQRLRHLNYLTFGASFYSHHNSHLHMCSAAAEMGDRLATIDMDRKLGAVPLWTRGSWVPIYNTMWPGSRPISLPSGIFIHPAVWPQQTRAESWGRLCPFGEGELDPHLTQCGHGRGLPPCQVSSWSIQPFGHNTPTLQTEQRGQIAQDRQTDRQTGQRSDSIGRTVLQTVAQNSATVTVGTSLILSNIYRSIEAWAKEARLYANHLILKRTRTICVCYFWNAFYIKLTQRK